MKTIQINRITFLFILMLGWMTVKGQQQWEVPGDNFSLEGALEIFKKSATPEEFERMLNDPDARINNLDLNGDGYIDYIRVIDLYEGNVHTFVLQAAISEYESQDIAVITLEKQANGQAILQITGDADIYGVETIIEPTREVRTYAGANRSRVVVNVWSWPMVRYVYGPYYSVWVSPWGWSYRPYWWNAWRPIVYYDYYTFWRPYRWHYSICFTRRVFHAHRIYQPFRTTSVIVHNRHHHRINEYRSRYIEREGQYHSRASRYGNRQSRDVRYNSEGRIQTNANSRTSSRPSSIRSTNQSRSSARSVGGNTVQRASRNSQRNPDNYNARISTERSTSDTRLRSSDRRSNMQESAGRSSDNANMRRSSGSSSIQRPAAGSSNGSNYRRSTGSNNIQRSTGRSSGSANLQRSQQRSGSNANIQRSQQRSGSSANLRQSKGSSNSRKSYNSTSGNSGSRISSRSSEVRKSNSNRSGIQRSSNRSGSTNSRSSGSSSNNKRGRD